jgi:mannose-6-phosphate isomerase-like protein (cupin superfamily)
MRHVRTAELPGSADAHRFEGADHGAPVSFFVVHARSGEGPDLHRHPYAETFVIHEGQATFTVGDQTIEARAGDILVAPADVPHSFRNSGSTVLRSVNIHPVAEMETVWL